MHYKRRVSECLAIALLMAFAFTAQSLAQRAGVEKDLERSFSDFSVSRFESGRLRSNGGARITVSGRSYDLKLFPRELRSRNYRAENTGLFGRRPADRAASDTFMGFIDGDAGSYARLTVRDGAAEGYFYARGVQYMVEPAKRYSEKAAPDDLVIYKPGDHLDDRGFFCESDLEERLERGKAFVNASPRSELDGPGVIEIATDADLEFVTELGSPAQANAEILGILNMVEGTFQAELDLSILVVYQHTWTSADPYNGTNGSNLLNSFKAHWNANFPTSQYPRDTAHLFSSKPAVASSGVAFLGTICRSPSSAYGFSGRITWAPGKYLVPAHELGHNLNAGHVDETQGCGNTLMNPVLSGSTPMSFCQFSRTQINDYKLANGDCLAPPSSGPATVFDFDGDSKTDISVWRPANGVWYIFKSIDNGYSIFQFGQNGDRTVAGDYDGDGKADAAVYRAGSWYALRSSDGTFTAVQFGIATDIPVPADFDGDGKSDTAVFRPETGIWHMLRSSDGGYAAVQFGLNGDIPVPADYDGDGKADVNVWRPANGVWYRLNSSNGSFTAVQFGQGGDKPVRGDFDGDAKIDIAVFRPTTGNWYVLRSTNSSFYAVNFGILSDIPTPGDFDGDGKTDVSVFRPESGIWYRLNSGNGSVSAVNFGLATDVPAPAS